MGKLLEEFNKIEEEIKNIKDEKEREKVKDEEKVKRLLEFLKNNVVSNLDIEDISVENGVAYLVAKNVKDKMNVNQLRKFFTQIKRIDNELKGKKSDDDFDSTKTLPLLPELAYAYGRKLITSEFYELMKICLRKDKIPKVKDFRRLVEFLSAILAYYKMLSK